MKKISISFLLFFSYVIGFSQYSNEYLKAADQFYNAGDYYSAAQYYEKHLTMGKAKDAVGFNPYAVTAVKDASKTVKLSEKNEIIFRLAESYRRLHFHQKALPYYEQAKSLDKNPYPLAAYHYAVTLKSLGKNEEAATAMQQFADSYSADDNYKASANLELQSLAYAKTQLQKKTIEKYTITKGAGLNAQGGTYAPVWLNNETLFITSTRPTQTDKSNTTTNRLYQVAYSEGAAGAVSSAALPQQKNVHQGVISFSADGNTMFLTRWHTEKGKSMAGIYSSKKSANGWTEPVAVEAINNGGGNNQQPFVMPGGNKILFSSDRPGGMGGYDIWSADVDANGNISNVANLSAINTIFDEQAATYHSASNTLVFSSNGRVGMGGYDFYYSKGSLDALQSPVNFGYPVNSAKDELYFASKGSATNILENVLFSSDRDNACCLEIYSLSKTKAIKQISGRVVACETNQPLNGVAVLITDADNKTIVNTTTDAAGKYSFTMADYEKLKASTTMKGYFAGSLLFSGPADMDEEVWVNPDICMKLIPEEAIRINNIYYDYNKSKLRKESYPALDSLVALLNENPTILIELGAHTDSKGSDEYNLKLSEARAQSVVDYLIGKGIDKSRLMAKGYGETMPVAENENADGGDNPEGRQENRRTEFKVIKN
ncbi:MAG TPA: OmpA family protein [Ferruginibacter sp.]|nr:OmpA family protein [Ferruginibacter sp.]